MAERRILTTTDDGSTLAVASGAVWITLQTKPWPVEPKLEGETLKRMLQACLEALGESGVVLGRKGG